MKIDSICIYATNFKTFNSRMMTKRLCTCLISFELILSNFYQPQMGESLFTCCHISQTIRSNNPSIHCEFKIILSKKQAYSLDRDKISVFEHPIS